MEIKIDQNARVGIREGDLDVYMSLGFIVRHKFGTLVALRSELEKLFLGGFTYPTISSRPLFVVHWNDLSEKKQSELEGNKRNDRARKR